ncbi:MAG: hypothetical protein KKC05_02135 [Nanoarchaeota archaeon]|nr:hypothetical protein [Nanoarchaeota archaeon]
MGLFDRFRNKEEVVQEEKINIDLSNLEKWSQREFKAKHEESVSTIKDLHSNILAGFGDIRTNLKKLEEASFEEDDKRYAAANMIKDTFVNKTNAILKEESEIGDVDYSGLKKFYLNSVKNMKELTNITPKQSVLLTSYFSEQTREVIRSVRQTESKLNKLNDFLENNGKVIWVMQRIKDDTQKQNEEMEKYTSFRKQIDAKKREIERLHGEVKKSSDDLNQIIKDPRWKDIDKLDKDIYYVEKKLEESKNSLDQAISYINRPLKKLEYATSHGYSPGQGTNLIERFLTKPLESMIAENGMNELKQILELIRQGNRDEKTPLKPKEEEKILDLIRRCGSDLPIIAAKYKKLTDELEEKRNLRGSLHPELPEHKKSVEERIKEQKKEIELLHKDIKYTESDMELLLNTINSRKKGLEKIISDHTKKKITIEQSV